MPDREPFTPTIAAFVTAAKKVAFGSPEAVRQ
jgi:hypothetical protein